MKITHLAIAGLAALALAACESKSDKVAESQSDAIQAAAETKADAMENRADTVESMGGAANEAAADAMDKQADAVRDAADAKGDAIEKAAGNAVLDRIRREAIVWIGAIALIFTLHQWGTRIIPPLPSELAVHAETTKAELARIQAEFDALLLRINAGGVKEGTVQATP